MKSVVEVIDLAGNFLGQKRVARPRRMAEELLSAVLKCRRIDLYLKYDRPVEEAELDILRDWLKRLAKGEPLEYIVGEVAFYGCVFKVDPRALIPRPETEILADWVAKRIHETSLWDLCTGSGVLAISLKKKIPKLQVVASDVDEVALSLAKENATLNGVDVEFLLGDFLAPFSGRTVDAVICNPPYISVKEYLELDPSVRQFEPRRALVGGEKGVEFYERLAEQLPPFLNPRGQLFLEIGVGQGEVIQKIFTGPPWRKGELLLDWAGKPRFFFLEKQ